MNLIQQQNYLEYANKDDLIKMMSEPVPQFPSFLVLSEIQRRTINEQNFKAMQERPTTTVAEEVVGNFMQPQLAQNQSQGLQGGTPQSATPLPDSNSLCRVIWCTNLCSYANGSYWWLNRIC
jgi:hypothetical protein